MTAPTVPPDVEGEPAARRSRFALPHGWWRKRPDVPIPGGHLLRAPWLLGLAAALWAAVLGLLLAAAPMLILWLGDLGSGWVPPLRHAGLLWLVAQGVPVSIAGITLTLLPWGLILVPLVLLGIGGAWAARRSSSTSLLDLVLIVVPGVVLYTAVGAVVASVASEPQSRVDLLQAGLGCLIVSLVGLGWGVVRGSGALSREVIPDVVLVPLRAGLLAIAFVVGAGAVAATASMIVSIDDAITMARALSGGLGGGLGLLLLGVAYVPVVVVWGASYVLGAGVTLGPSSSLSPFLPAGAPAELPPFPLLAALPQQAPPLAWALPLVGVIAGLLAGALIGRRLRHEQRLVRLAGAAGAALLAGAGMALLAWLSSGSLGTEALRSIGPEPSVLAVLTVMLVAIGAVPAALVPSPPARPTLSVAAAPGPVGEGVDEAMTEPEVEGLTVDLLPDGPQPDDVLPEASPRIDPSHDEAP